MLRWNAQADFSMGRLVLSALIVLAAAAAGGGASGQRVCRHTFRKVNHLTIEDVAYDSPVHGTNQTCSKATNYCYALWKEDTHNNTWTGNVTIIAQACWESSGSYDCEKSSCIASRKPSKALKDTYFCCCNENFCNEHVSHKYEEEEEEEDDGVGEEEEVAVPEVMPTQVVKYVEDSYLLVVVTLVIVLLLIATALFMRKDMKKKRKKKKSVQNQKGNQDSLHLMESGDPYASNFTVENLRLDGILGQGRYGAVWKGFVGDQQVAVKIFPSHHKNYFYNELDIYTLPFMTHPSLLYYFGYDERTAADGAAEYFLFLSLAPNGCVQDYLRSNVLDWDTFCKMALSVARGVAYLHTDIQKGDKLKPCITHRDLNTKNILVKEDLSCVICDLGFATKISGSKYYYNGEEREAETKSINDVGTLRYMSPEILEGAVNLRDCETSLKQIDVYALGLILWEIASRCPDFYPPGVECAPYKLPFEAEIGHPTFEQMQILVCRHKARPLFPDLWRDTPSIRTVKETIEDCWDQDAEARLTALCVEERFHELSGLSERQKSSLYPNGISPMARTSLVQRESANVLAGEHKEGDSCVSESTVETLLAISPANPQVHYKNSNQFQAVCPSVQPYQGRNPCLERNLMLPHGFDAKSSELIDKSHKDMSKNLESSPPTTSDGLNLNVLNSAGYNSYSTHSEPVPRSNASIPFVQNVNSEGSCQIIPKRANVSKRGVGSIAWRNLMRVFEGRKRGAGSAGDISPQIDCNANSNLIVNESGEHLTTPTASLEVALTKGRLETKLARDKGAEGREGLPLGARNARRPNTLDLPRRHGVATSGGRKAEKPRKTQNPGVPRKRYSLNASSASPSRKREERDAKAKSLSGIEELDKRSLAADADGLRKKSLEEVFSMDKSSGAQLKDPNLRIKTPGDVPLAVRKMRSERNTARFSLYDDRIMSGHYENETLYSCATVAQNNCNGSKFLNSFEDIKFSQNI